MGNNRDWRFEAITAVLNIQKQSDQIMFGSVGVAYGAPEKVVRESPGKVLEKVCEAFPKMLACAAERLLAIQESKTESEFEKRDAEISEKFNGTHH